MHELHRITVSASITDADWNNATDATLEDLCDKLAPLMDALDAVVEQYQESLRTIGIILRIG